MIVLNFFSIAQNQFGDQIKSFKTDKAKDYFNQILSPFFQYEGIFHDLSNVNTPRQIGVVECKMGFY